MAGVGEIRGVADYAKEFAQNMGEMSVANILIYVMFFGVSAALPTICYGLISSTLIAAYFAPEWVRRVVTNTIYLVSTDSKPVMSQLGTAFGTLSGIAAGFASALKTIL